MNFDDNAMFRQKELFQLRDLSQIDEKEVAAQKFDLNYIALDGNMIKYISYHYHKKLKSYLIILKSLDLNIILSYLFTLINYYVRVN